MKPPISSVGTPDAVHQQDFAFEEVTIDDLKRTMFYKGRVADVMERLHPSKIEEGLRNEFWSAPLVARAVIDNPVPGVDRTTMVNQATQYATEVFAGNPTEHHYNTLKEALKNADLLSRTVQQPYDEVKAKATDPRLAALSAAQIAIKTEDMPGSLFLLPLCHSGLPACLATKLYLQQGDKDVAMYPVRYSKRQHKDDAPFIVHQEEEYLKKSARGATVIVFDELAESGQSLRDSVLYFSQLFRKARVLGFAGYDLRDEMTTCVDGQWWEHWAYRELSPAAKRRQEDKTRSTYEALVREFKDVYPTIA